MISARGFQDPFHLPWTRTKREGEDATSTPVSMKTLCPGTPAQSMREFLHDAREVSVLRESTLFQPTESKE